jgi:antirestriction protein ArdC
MKGLTVFNTEQIEGLPADYHSALTPVQNWLAFVRKLIGSKTIRRVGRQHRTDGSQYGRS